MFAVSLDAIKADPRIMLACSWDGVPLKQEHGFPLRIYIPDVHGMKQPKWIESIEAIDHWEPGYWVERGWEKVAQMHATSVNPNRHTEPSDPERGDRPGQQVNNALTCVRSASPALPEP